MLLSFWHQQNGYKSNTGLLRNPIASHLHKLLSMKEKKAEYVSVTGKQSTILLMIFSPEDTICFLTDELWDWSSENE